MASGDVDRRGRLPIVGGAPAPSLAPSLPTVDALEALWEQVNSRPLWFPPHTGRYLRLRRRMRLGLLDPERARLVMPRWKLNDCHSCTDICCVGPRSTVLLRLRDIATLVDLGRTELLAHEKPEFSAAELDRRPALWRQVHSSSWSVFPVLARDPMGACRALGRDGRCGLFPSWPLACARFPYSLHLELEEVFFSRRCDSYWIRPDGEPAAQAMIRAAVAAYNERIKDGILLEYARADLEALGLLAHLRLPPGSSPP